MSEYIRVCVCVCVCVCVYIYIYKLTDQSLYLTDYWMGTGKLSPGVKRPERGDYSYLALVKTELMWAPPEHRVREVLIIIGRKWWLRHGSAVRLSLCTPWRRTDDWWYSSTHPCPRQTVEMHGQFHTAEKKSPGAHWRGGRVSDRTGLDVLETRYPLTLPEIEPWFLWHPCRSLVIMPTTLPRLSEESKPFLSSSCSMHMFFKDPNVTLLGTNVSDLFIEMAWRFRRIIRQLSS
jgi:hypothetical protein